MKTSATELEYLRYFVKAVYPALGPADDEIVSIIQEDFEKKTGKLVPKKYRREEG